MTPMGLSSTRFDSDILINKPCILEMIRQLMSENSLSALKDTVKYLKEVIFSKGALDQGYLSKKPGEDTIQFKSHSLLEQLRQIEESQTIQRAKYYIQRLEKSLVEVKTNKINDINLNRWKDYDDILTESLWVIDKRDNSGVHTSRYWGNFIPQIPYQMIKRYTKQGEWVLDTFAGMGTTLIESQRLGRNSIGIELQESIAGNASQLIKREQNLSNVTNKVYVGDSKVFDYKQVLNQHNIKGVQLVMMHPPYFDIIKFSDDQRDLSNAGSVDQFLQMMEETVQNAASILDKKRYLILVIGDKYAEGTWFPLGFLTMQKVLNQGFILKSIVVKNFESTAGKRTQKDLWNYRALLGGFYIFKHEYIFVFQKK